MNIENILKNLKEFSKIPSVVGYEEEFLIYLQKRLKEIDVVSKLENGLLVVETNDKKCSDHFTCLHVDREGLVVKNGKLLYATQFLSIKKFDEKQCQSIGKRFVNKKIEIENKIYKITGFKTLKNKKNEFDLEFLLNKKIAINNQITSISISKSIKTTKDYISGQLDNTLNVAIVFEMLKNKIIKGNVIFSIREEIGESGKLITDYLKNKLNYTDNLIILDTTPFSKKDYILGEITLRNRDSKNIYSINKNKKIEEICKELKIHYRYKDKILEEKKCIKIKEDGSFFGYGLTELSNIIKESKGKFNGTTLQIPVIENDLNEIVFLKNLDNYVKVLKRLFILR